jgi:hypothetical protein
MNRGSRGETRRSIRVRRQRRRGGAPPNSHGQGQGFPALLPGSWIVTNPPRPSILCNVRDMSEIEMSRRATPQKKGLSFIPALMAWHATFLADRDTWQVTQGLYQQWGDRGMFVFFEWYSAALRARAKTFRRWFRCLVCRQPFPGFPNRRFCYSPICQWLGPTISRTQRRRERWWNWRDRANHRCHHCNRLVSPTRKSRRYCGDACRVKAWRKRNAKVSSTTS